MNDLTVKTVQAKWLEKLPPLRLAVCCSILSAAMLTVYVPVAAIAYSWHGPDGFWAASVAGLVCWLGSSLALTGTSLFGRGGPNGPMLTIAFGLVFNCALPFTMGLILSRMGGGLAQAGVFGQIVIFFQCALVIETLLSLCLIKLPR